MRSLRHAAASLGRGRSLRYASNGRRTLSAIVTGARFAQGPYADVHVRAGLRKPRGTYSPAPMQADTYDAKNPREYNFSKRELR